MKLIRLLLKVNMYTYHEHKYKIHRKISVKPPLPISMYICLCIEKLYKDIKVNLIVMLFFIF